MAFSSTSFTTSDGLRIAYTDIGSGPPVVFLHGVGSTRRVWDRQLALLSDRFHCIAVEYRGYPESQTPLPLSLQP